MRHAAPGTLESNFFLACTYCTCTVSLGVLYTVYATVLYRTALSPAVGCTVYVLYCMPEVLCTEENLASVWRAKKGCFDDAFRSLLLSLGNFTSPLTTMVCNTYWINQNASRSCDKVAISQNNDFSIVTITHSTVVTLKWKSIKQAFKTPVFSKRVIINEIGVVYSGWSNDTFSCCIVVDLRCLLLAGLAVW